MTVAVSITPLLPLIVIISLAAFVRTRRRLRLPYPPGPKPSALPLIGNLFNVPTEQAWITYSEWGRTYGPVIMLELSGQKFCVLNTLEAAQDLLVKRSKIYSERPPSPMVNELLGWNFSFGMKNLSDPTYAPSRRLFVREFSKHLAQQYQDPQIQENVRFLDKLLRSPENFAEHLKSEIGAISMAITYGYPVKEDDPFLLDAEEGLRVLSVALQPGAFLVDAIPFLRHVPEWFPGANFRRFAREGKACVDRMQQGPWEWASEQYSKGVAKLSLFSRVMAQHNDATAKMDIEAIRRVCAVVHSVAVETTQLTVITFILAMLHNPKVQYRAHEEIYRVTGGTRLPTFDDYDSFTFIHAMVKETLRWESVTPLSLPHVTLEDDVYNGYLIPKGTTVWANQWAMAHEPIVYPDPMEFNPERFLGDEPQQDPALIVFGFGKRICPGRFLAEKVVWLHIATLLACFEIKRVKDEAGNDVIPPRKYSTGLTSRPEPFQCNFVPRPGMASIIKDSLAALDE